MNALRESRSSVLYLGTFVTQGVVALAAYGFVACMFVMLSAFGCALLDGMLPGKPVLGMRVDSDSHNR